MTAPVTRVPFDMRQLPVAIGSGLTHRGMVRENNEDSILTDPDGVLWAVADGMGGYGNGDVASDIVMDCLSAIDDTADPAEQLAAMLEIANERVRAVG
ncbi:MAG TPA: serine/threonine-protein phosphatase, partial [Rhodobacteraceae bacterium]|nr:serine/threonine-protein phosphatase [Paracoccaceae bacterium]